MRSDLAERRRRTFRACRLLPPALAHAWCPGIAWEHQARVPAAVAVSGEDCSEPTEERRGCRGHWAAEVIGLRLQEVS